MIRGLYTSGWSMLANNKKMDVITNNLSNVNTYGYKRDVTVFQSFPEALTMRMNEKDLIGRKTSNIGTMELGSDIGEIHTYYSQGSLLKTDDKYNFAIKDSDLSFFTIGVPDQDGTINEYYTRDGSFTINSNNELTTSEGFLVLGEGGPIVLEDGDFFIERDGTIIQYGEVVDKLLIRTFADNSGLRKVGSNLLQSVNNNYEGVPFEGTIVQGYVEQSNVNIIKEMVEMINVMRAYESNQKMIQVQDSTLEKAVNEVGAVR
ncbi:MAG TPA: flagellar hook-basal body protein [Clostridiaceae bacterium]|nr:flagellar hook-basal body protein [Clostridiaceae bacterium]